MTIAYYIIHYGIEYLSYSIESIYENVDKIFIFYSSIPSHGTATSLVCPDSKEDLKKMAFRNDLDNKINWIDKDFHNEVEQRSYATNYCKEQGAEVILLVDYDEVWIKEKLKECIADIKNEPCYSLLIKMEHLWRNFNYSCIDEMSQCRLIHTKADVGTTRYVRSIRPQVYHFGYCIRPEIMSYKWKIHGHSSELRTDCDWYNDKWLNWEEGIDDTHPTCLNNTWFPKPFSKAKLPILMTDHPYWNKKVIE